MKTLELMEPERRIVHREDVIELPYGLLGFERVKDYVLIARPHEQPFMWFQMVADSNQAFLVVPPSLVAPDYQPDLSGEDVEFLGLTCPEDAMLLNIVTLRGGGPATVNLKGPIVINRQTFIGKQVIPNNAAQYSLRHPLPVA